ncbi:MAG TPA: RNA 3'-terminal phosphate cyclase [Myxococcota bacterium]|nr:RNA 3'-terminal phosphate cyclase [Myxococcota bacterium]
MLSIDGSQGEGGGQILRSALALALITGTPFRIDKIRAGRKKPGLLRQHLAALRAAVEIGQAEAGDPQLGAESLEFRPGRVKPGEYRFAVATAGSACLVVQTVLPPLLLADGPSRLVVEGGTHNPAAPPWDYLARVFFPLLERMGPRVRTSLERHGFYPAGGGRLCVEIEPVPKLRGFELTQRGALVTRRARAILSHLPREIGERELETLRRKLSDFEGACAVEHVDSPGPGNALLVELECEHVTELFASFGERGLRAHVVAERAVEQVRDYLMRDVPVGPQLADQLVLPLALAGEGEFRTGPLTPHAYTNLDVVQRFLPARALVSPVTGGGFALRFS